MFSFDLISHEFYIWICIEVSFEFEVFWSMYARISEVHSLIFFSPAYRRTLETEVSVSDEWWVSDDFTQPGILVIVWYARTLLFGILEHLSWKRW